MEIHDSVLDLIGNTPLVRLNRVTRGLRPQIVAKIESFNPGGSVKDRIGIRMLEDAEKRGLLRPGGTIVEPTSGNTGAGLAIAAAIKGYRTVFVMPDKMSNEKVALLNAYGAEVVRTPTAVPPESPDSYYRVADRLAREIPGGFQPNQYYNQSNPETHYMTTGPEIWRQTDGKITHFVAGVGTGGTISGTGRYLKEQNPDIIVIAADPEGSILSGGELHPYAVEGIGEDFFPGTFDPEVVDRWVRVSDRDSFRTARRVTREEGILVGGSCGTALVAAFQVAQELDEDALMVVILPDSGRGYLSKVYNDQWMEEHGYLERFPPARVADLIRMRHGDIPEMVAVAPNVRVGQAIDMLQEYGISQMPVAVLRDGNGVAEPPHDNGYGARDPLHETGQGAKEPPCASGSRPMSNGSATQDRSSPGASSGVGMSDSEHRTSSRRSASDSERPTARRTSDIVGSIQEKSLLARVFRDPSMVENLVEEVMDAPLDLVDLNDSVEAIVEPLLGTDSALVAVQGDRPVSVVTRSDLLEFIAHHRVKPTTT